MATGDSTLGQIPKVSASDIKYDETPIGRGGYGYVYRGVHKDLGTVAIKTMIADGLLPARHLRVFKAEGRKLWDLRHPSIVRLLGLIMEEGNYSLVLEYMHFGSLTAFRSDFVDCDWSLIISIIRDVIHGMNYLHSTDPPILHLDLKSDNILINRRIRAKITDFGLSQWKTMTRTMTRGGEDKGRKGTVTHVPPEVWNNINTPPNKAYDVYSFAIVLWETMVGDRPFARVSDDVIPKAVLSGQRPDSTLVPSSCPPELVNMMTASWVQQPEKRLQFEAMVPDIDKLFENVAPRVAEGLSKLEKEIQNLYTTEDLGGDTAATANSESLFDAATKLTSPSTASPMSVEMEDIGEEMDIPETSVPHVPDSQKLPIVGLQDEEEPGPSGVRTGAASSKSASTSASTSASGAGTASTTASTSASTPGGSTQASQTQPKVPASQASSTAPGTTNQAQGTPEEQVFVMNDEQKKALRRVLRDPVGMLLMHKDAELCKRVFGVDLELQKKVKNTGELLKLLEQDTLLRVELQRKGAEHFGWLFNPHRMKDEIRRKRPARTPKPEVVEKMNRLREERQKREKDLPRGNYEDMKERRGLAAGIKGLFKKDKHKMRGPMSKYMHPMDFDPYGPMGDMMSMRASMGMGMNISPDIAYKLKRILRDPQMVRYMLGEQKLGRMVAVDREVMELLQDPDKMMYLMTQDPSLMQALSMTDHNAFMKIVARARGGPSRMRDMMRGPRRMPGMYRGLERDMMDMDLDDEMMMMYDADRYQRHRMDREMMNMLKNPGLPSNFPSSSSSTSSATSKPSCTVSKPPSTSSDSTTPKVTVSNTGTTGTTSSTTSSSATNTTSSTTGNITSSATGNTPSSTTGNTTSSTTGNTTSSTTGSDASSASGSGSASNTGGTSAKADVATRIGESSRKIVEPERREIQGLPDDHLVQRQENIKTPVQRHTDTEPIQTALDMLRTQLNQPGEAPQPSLSSQTEVNNSSSSQGAQAVAGSTSTEPKSSKSGKSKKSEKEKKVHKSQSNSSTGGQGQSSTGGQGQSSTAGQGQSSTAGQGRSSTAGGGHGSVSFTMTDPSSSSREEIRISLNPDGSMTGNYDPFKLPPGIQFGQNNTMVLDHDRTPKLREAVNRREGANQKHAKEYQHKWMKFSKKHKIAQSVRGGDIKFEHVNMIAENIGNKWIDLAEHLKMDPRKLRDLKIEYQATGEDDYDCCVRVLEDLLTRRAYYSTPDLIQDLKEINCQKIAIKLISLLEF